MAEIVIISRLIDSAYAAHISELHLLLGRPNKTDITVEVLKYKPRGLDLQLLIGLSKSEYNAYNRRLFVEQMIKFLTLFHKKIKIKTLIKVVKT